MKKALILFFTILPIYLLAQDKNIEKVLLEFRYFKYFDTAYKIDYKKKEINCIMKYKISENRDTIFLDKTYNFTNRQFRNFKNELTKNIPDSILRKSEPVFDGGGFVINYFKTNGTTCKLIARNINRKSNKYHAEFKLIDSFFEFIYSVVKDKEGLKILDESYRPYFSGLPIRKISENPLEYKIWGSISGNATWKNDLIPFIESLPKDKCVIIDCDNQLSYSWQEDILRLYILKKSNLRFANMDWLKYTRENIIQLKGKIESIGNNEEELNKLKSSTTFHLYMNDRIEIDNWLELPEKSIFTSVEEYKKNCR